MIYRARPDTTTGAFYFTRRDHSRDLRLGFCRDEAHIGHPTARQAEECFAQFLLEFRTSSYLEQKYSPCMACQEEGGFFYKLLKGPARVLGALVELQKWWTKRTYLVAMSKVVRVCKKHDILGVKVFIVGDPARFMEGL